MTGPDALDLVLGKLDAVRQQGGYWMARCPAHEDRKASLSVARGDVKPVLLHCFAGCRPDDVIAAVGVTWADLSANGDRPDGDGWTPSGPGTAIATYLYTDQAGKVLMGVCRTAGKKFWQWRPDPAKPYGRAWSAKGVKLVLYRLPAVLAAVDAGETVYVAEGEKDVHSLEAAGVTATCNPMGAGKWRAAYSTTLAGANVVIVADNDQPGRDHARKVAAMLDGRAASVRVVRARDGKDASDHLAAGNGVGDFADLAPEDSEPVSAAQAAAPRPPVKVARGDGAAILDDTEAAYLRYVAWGSEAQPAAVTLWTAHTHAIEAADTTPYLDINSPEPESGKTRVLEVAELLAARGWMLVEPSEAAMFRKIAKDSPAILLDEYDALWGGKADGRESLRAILNVGYRRGATVPRCVGDGGMQTVEDFPVFGAKALAGLSGKLPRTIATRSIPIRLQRRAKSRPVERFRFARARAELQPLHDRLAAWAGLVTPGLRDASPVIPPSLSDRQADCWEPLLAIADTAGGHWPQRARDAAIALHGADPAADPSTGVLLLAHIADAFAAAGEEQLSTAALLGALVSRDDGPWPQWWEKDLNDGRVKGPSSRLAHLLKPYSITPGQLWTSAGKTRGYKLESFRKSFGIYLDQDLPSGTPGPTDLENGRTVAAGQGMFPGTGEESPRVPDLRATDLPSGNRPESVGAQDEASHDR